MKNRFVAVCLILCVGIVCFYSGRCIAIRSYVTNRKVTFVTDLSVLEDLRIGNITNAINTLELYCYSSASSSLESYLRDHDRVVKETAIKLVEYRKKYAGSKSEWSPTEQKLEEQLYEIIN